MAWYLICRQMRVASTSNSRSTCTRKISVMRPKCSKRKSDTIPRAYVRTSLENSEKLRWPFLPSVHEDLPGNRKTKTLRSDWPVCEIYGSGARDRQWSQWSGSNRRPTVYETVALPLSYIGIQGFQDLPPPRQPANAEPGHDPCDVDRKARLIGFVKTNIPNQTCRETRSGSPAQVFRHGFRPGVDLQLLVDPTDIPAHGMDA